MSLIESIKSCYPSPIAMSRIKHDTVGYCVGGAICLYNAEHLPPARFPCAPRLAKRLVELNPSLPAALADQYARMIIHNNDLEAFNQAWQIAASALEYQPQEG